MIVATQRKRNRVCMCLRVFEKEIRERHALSYEDGEQGSLLGGDAMVD